MKKIKRLLSSLGPGFITGASDDDPSGIGTYSQTGAQFGYGQLWIAPFSFPFMVIVQEICGRIGMVTGKGIAVIVRDNYSKKILYFTVLLLAVANAVNIGADLGAMASAGQLIWGVNFLIWLIGITLVTLFLEILVPYPAYARFLKYLTFSLFAYLISAFIIQQDWAKIISSTFIPYFSFSKEYLLNIVALLGTTISPYLFFWQADEEIEEEIEHKKLQAMGKGIPRIRNKDIRQMRLDTAIGMFFSNLITFFIIVVTASTLHLNNISNIQTATDAAVALRPIAGNFAFILFAAGIMGTGFLSVPVLAGSASYAVSEAMGWRASLNLKFKKAHKFYIVIMISTLVGVLVNFTPIKPFQLLYYTAVLNGICAPPLMILLMLISNNKNIMHEHTNSWISNVLGWSITVIMSIASLALILSFIGLY